MIATGAMFENTRRVTKMTYPSLGPEGRAALECEARVNFIEIESE